ncbi:50S ribosomal protein L34e [Candidatus Woesearchaeota archaeon]|nr:50S ribosomal protein L34e [Candidatus Woesearchaeota archaeon]
MPAPRLRSRSLRKVFRKVPGNRVSLQYKRRKHKAARCGSCGNVLHGAPRALPFQMKSLPKTKRRPERPYGGVLCSRCMRQEIVNKIRQ